jgi:hypothetical protein
MNGNIKNLKMLKFLKSKKINKKMKFSKKTNKMIRRRLQLKKYKIIKNKQMKINKKLVKI